MGCLFTIAVPVYNVERYIAQCVQSVLTQSFGDFELLLVDDGSTDKSGALCDELAASDPRARVIHRQNGGLADARDVGIREARGRYLLFLDGDDFYADGCLAKLAALCADEPDLILFNYARYCGEKGAGKPQIAFPTNLSGDYADDMQLLSERNAYVSSACFRAVKTDVIRSAALEFERGTLSEDVEFSAKLMKLCTSVRVLDEPFYLYRVREGSITKTVSAKHVDDLLAALGRLSGEPPENEALRSAYMAYAAFQFCTLLINARIAVPPLDTAAHERVRGMSGLLKYSRCTQARLIERVYSVLGYGTTSRLLVVYFNLFR